MNNWQIAPRTTETGRTLYMIYDKDETDQTQYGTCGWTIKVCARYNYWTKSYAYKKLKALKLMEVK